MKTLEMLKRERESIEVLVHCGYDLQPELDKVIEKIQSMESSERLDKAIQAVNKANADLKKIEDKIKQNRNNQPWNPINLPPQENPKEDWKGNKWTGD